MARLRVVHVINSLGAGGAEKLLATNLKHFDLAARDHFVVTLDETGDGFWRAPLSALGVPVLPLGATSRWKMARAGFTLANWLRRNRADVVHAHLSNAMLVAREATMLTRRPLVTTLHSLSYSPEILAELNDPQSPKHDVARLLEGWLHTRCDDLVLAVGETVARSAVLRLHLPPERVRVVPVPLDLAPAAAGSRETLRARLGLSSSARLLLHVGRVVPLKGHQHVIDALPALLERGHDVHFAAVGPAQNAEWTEELRARARQLNLESRVHFIGAQQDIAAWHAAADLFVFPSAYEGHPIALVEALASGLPAVASDIPSNRELSTLAPALRFAELRTQSALAEALHSALQHLAGDAARSRNASAAIRAHYDPSRIARLHELTYDALALRGT